MFMLAISMQSGRFGTACSLSPSKAAALEAPDPRPHKGKNRTPDTMNMDFHAMCHQQRLRGGHTFCAFLVVIDLSHGVLVAGNLVADLLGQYALQLLHPIP